MEWYGLLQDAMEEFDEKLTGFRDDIIREIRKTEPTPPEPGPEPAPTPIPAGKIGTGRSYRNLNPGQCRIWEFVPTKQERSKRLQVSNTPQPTQPHTVFMLIKKGGKPTIAEFEKTWKMPVSTWRESAQIWHPPKPGAENLYWQYTTGTELVEILDNPVGNDRYFIMLYNKGSKPVRSQRLIIMCSV